MKERGEEVEQRWLKGRQVDSYRTDEQVDEGIGKGEVER